MCCVHCRLGSRRLLRDQYIREIVQRQRFSEAVAAEQQLRASVGDSSSDSSSGAAYKYAVAYSKAAETSRHALGSTHETASLSFIGNPTAAGASLNQGYAARSLDIRGWDDAMPLLPRRLQEFLMACNATNARQHTAANMQPLPSDRIRVHKYAVLADKKIS